MEDQTSPVPNGTLSVQYVELGKGDIDGVEIACQSGALIEQFWSPAMNYRTDRYGGSLENRMRFGLEVLEAIRHDIGEDYVVGIRMSGDEMLRGGLNQDDCTPSPKSMPTAA
ncbi:MAG: hypothetical protein CM1200mP18_11600 [Gammaproteobacteria bacterium]|nr:MAG: hypothetical protein CM1200mP18_11600 [Gammaproteobacteria bacterium]